MAANDELLDASVRHQIGLQRLSTATVRKAIALLNRVDDDIIAQMIRNDPTAVTGTFSERRLEKLLEAVRAINVEAYRTLRNELSGELRELAVFEADFQSRMVQGAVPIQLDIVKPSAAQLTAAVNARPFQGRLLREWYSGLEQAAQRNVREAIRIGFVEGESIDAMVRRVRGTRAQQFRDGVLEMNRRQAEAVVRTATNHVANVARVETYRANDDVIKGIRYTATLDGRTTMRCASLDGKVFPVDSGPRPPQHVNCRSTTSPVLKSWREMGINLREAPEGTRASLDGQVPASTTYNEWLRRQSAGVQEDVLGKRKAQLFRRGELPVDRFVDRRGQELTLDQLRARESEVFEKAGLEV